MARPLRALAALGLALVVAGCGASDTGTGSTARTMTVVGVEMAFRAPSQVESGNYQVTFRNDGLVWHELAIRDSSGTFLGRRSIAPKQAITFPVKLKAGTYELGCYEPGHYERGMHQALAVS